MGHTTTNPNRAGEISRTGTASAFLAPGFATGEIHIALGLRAGCSAATSSLDSHHDIVHGLIAFGLVGDEFNLRLLGVLGGENCRAHELETETAQALRPACEAASEAMCGWKFILVIRRFVLLFGDKKTTLAWSSSYPQGLTGSGKLQVDENQAR